MYAVIRTGGKQYTVKPGDVLHVEKLEQKLGAEFVIDDILILGGDVTHVGQPVVKNAKVTVVVTKQARGPKIIVFKKKRRHSFRKFKHHKQPFTEIFVKSITSPEGKTESSDQTPNVVDIAEVRVQRIQEKVDARKERVESEIKANKNKGTESEAAPKKAAGKKKVSKKAVAKKAAPKTSKKAAAKKAGAKKATKKTAKK
jgi:large subunit ribosomal protein L21